MSSEILIIGGGVIGLSIAREIHKRGVKHITVLEQGVCGRESSWAAGGMLGPQAEADEGGAFFDMTLESRDLYPELASGLLSETGIDIELERTGTLYLAFTDEDVRELRTRCEWQRNAGFAVGRFTAEEARKAEPAISDDVREAFLFPNDWQVENRRLLAALRRYAELKGVQIIEHTKVVRLVDQNNTVTGVETEAGIVSAEMTVLATGAWTSLIKLGEAEIPVKVEPVKGQIVAFQPAAPLFRHVIYSRRGYLVPRADGRLLAGSTSENVGFDKSTTGSAAKMLQEMACEISPRMSELQIADHWSGLRPKVADGMPVLGRISGLEGLFIATAHYRNGILLAPQTAKLAAGAIVDGTDSEYFGHFGPDRFASKRAGRGIGI